MKHAKKYSANKTDNKSQKSSDRRGQSRMINQKRSRFSEFMLTVQNKNE